MAVRRDLYRTLGLPYGATGEEVKSAYRRLAKQYHPDITKDQRSGAVFSEIVHAYKVLTVKEQQKTLIDFPVRNVRKPPRQKPKPRQEVDMFALGKLVTGGKTMGMRAFAARGLGNSGKKSSYAYLRKALYDTSDLVVKSAVEAIGKLKIRQSSGELASLYARGAREVRLAVLRAAAEFGFTGGFRSILFSGMKDKDYEIRKLALSYFSNSSS